MNEASARYVNPLTDFSFRKLFGEAVNKDIPGGVIGTFVT